MSCDVSTQYRERLDTVAAFLGEECVLLPTVWTPRPMLHAAYLRWAFAHKRTPVNVGAFYERIGTHPGIYPQKSGVDGFGGVALRAEAPDQRPGSARR